GDEGGRDRGVAADRDAVGSGHGRGRTAAAPARPALVEVDAERFRADFDALAAIGATPAGGVSRPTFGEAHFAARAWFLERAAASGLETQVDSAGNHSAVLPG